MNNLTPEQLAFRAGYEQGRFDAQVEHETRPYRLLQNNGSKYFGESWDKPEQPSQQRHISYVCPQCHWSLDKQPVSKPWVGLTDEQIEDLYFDNFSMCELKAFARAIESKLKEKNT